MALIHYEFVIYILVFGGTAFVEVKAEDIFAQHKEIEDTFDLLKQGENIIEVSEQYKDITLVLGNTGSGKSSFMHWIAGDNKKLKSVSDDGKKYSNEEMGQYIIEDEYKKIGSSILSQTIFPEQFIDNETNQAYYDCPGFSDTRSTSYDIATTYFIKKLTDHAENLKMIFVINYASVTKGVDRQDFMRMMKHTSELVLNIEKFKNSIFLVATKVDRADIKSEIIIKRIEHYLKQCKEILQSELVSKSISDDKKIRYSKFITFIDIILNIEDKGSSKIGIFRRPNKSGPLSEIPLLQNEKIKIKEMLNLHLKNTITTKDDFGYTISDQSKNIISGLVVEINKNVYNNTKVIAEKLQKTQTKLVNDIFAKLNLFYKSNETVSAEKQEARNYSCDLSTKEFHVLRLFDKIKNLTSVVDLAYQLNESTVHLKDDSLQENISNIAIQGKYLTFLQTVSKNKLSLNNFVDLIKPIKDSFFVSKRNIEKDIDIITEKLNSKNEQEMNVIGKEIEKNYLDKIEKLDIERSLFDLNQAKQVISQMKYDVSQSDTQFEISESTDKFISQLNVSSVILSKSLTGMKLNEKYIAYMSVLKNDRLTISLVKLINSLDKLYKFLSESESWYTFLKTIFEKFSEYKIQEQIKITNLVYVGSSGNLGKLQKMEITQTNYKEILRIIHGSGINHGIVENINPSESQLKKLNGVLKMTLRSSIVPECKQSKIVIKGNYIKFTDFTNDDGSLTSFCGNVKSVSIFSLNTVFIDRDLQGLGKLFQLSIVAPKWEIVDTRKISLDGMPGMNQVKASHGQCDGCHGDDGKPGNPGGPAGNLLGICQQIKNFHSLTISLNGGRGGDGQEGGHGHWGANGDNAYNDILNDERACLVEEVNYFFFKQVTKTCLGHPGKAGGNGGNGGKAGLAGITGHVKMIIFDQNPNLNIIKSTSNGSDGIRGEGADGGWYGYDATRTYIVTMFGTEEKSDIKSRNPKKQGPHGSNGISGYNSVGRQQPKNAERQSVSHIVSDFKEFMRDKFETFNRKALTKFYVELNSKIDRNNY